MPAAVSAPEVAPSIEQVVERGPGARHIGGGQERDDDLGEAALERLEEELARHERRALAGGIGERLPDPGIIEQEVPAGSAGRRRGCPPAGHRRRG